MTHIEEHRSSAGHMPAGTSDRGSDRTLLGVGVPTVSPVRSRHMHSCPTTGWGHCSRSATTKSTITRFRQSSSVSSIAFSFVNCTQFRQSSVFLHSVLGLRTPTLRPPQLSRGEKGASVTPVFLNTLCVCLQPYNSMLTHRVIREQDCRRHDAIVPPTVRESRTRKM